MDWFLKVPSVKSKRNCKKMCQGHQDTLGAGLDLSEFKYRFWFTHIEM